MSEVKDRIFKAFDYLKEEGKVKNLQEFADIIGTNKQGISDIKAGRKSVSLENIIKLKEFDAAFSTDWFLSNEGSMIKSYSNTEAYKLVIKEPEPIVQRLPKVVTTDNAGRDNIPLVPVRAAAGYLNGYADPEYIEKLPAYSLPNISNGTFRMFQVKGHSMMPALHDKSMVVGQFVEDWVKSIKDNRVYIIVSKEEGIIVKRCLNRIKKYGDIYCRSDNKKEFPEPIILKPEDILEVWEYKMHLSYHIPDPVDLYDRVTDLEADMNFLKEFIRKNALNS